MVALGPVSACMDGREKTQRDVVGSPLQPPPPVVLGTLQSLMLARPSFKHCQPLPHILLFLLTKSKMPFPGKEMHWDCLLYNSIIFTVILLQAIRAIKAIQSNFKNIY